MRALRRAALALGLASLAAGIVRLRGRGGKPPSWGGDPPVPRARSTAAIMPATPNATSPRRSIFIAGTSRQERNQRLRGRHEPVRTSTAGSGASWNRTSDLTLIRGAL